MAQIVVSTQCVGGLPCAAEPRTEMAFQLGVSLNQFDWSGRQAFLLGDGTQFADAANAVQRMRCLLLAFNSRQDGERGVDRIRKLEAEITQAFNSEDHCKRLDALQTTLAPLESVHDGTEEMAVEREEFLEPVAKWTERLREVVESSIGSEWVRVFRLGNLVDHGVRPPGVHRHVFQVPISDACADEKIDLESLEWWNPVSPPETPNPLANGCLAIVGTEPHHEFIRPFLDKSYSSKVGPRFTGNHVLTPGEIAPEPGWYEEVKVRWKHAFACDLELQSTIGLEDNSQNSPDQHPRTYQRIVSRINAGEPVCQLDKTKRLAVIDGKELKFGRAHSEFQLFGVLSGTQRFLSCEDLLEKLGKRKIDKNRAWLHTNLLRLRKRLQQIPLVVEHEGKGYALRREKSVVLKHGA